MPSFEKFTDNVIFVSISTNKSFNFRPQTKTRNYAEIQLIKRLDPWGVWLVHKEREIFVLNPFR